MGPVPLPQAPGQGKNPTPLAKRPMWFAGAVRFCARGARRDSATSTNNVTLFVVSRITQLVRRFRDPHDSGDYVGGSLLARRFRAALRASAILPQHAWNRSPARRRCGRPLAPAMLPAANSVPAGRADLRDRPGTTESAAGGSQFPCHGRPGPVLGRLTRGPAMTRKLQRDHLEDLFPDGH
jgi:hypothetical protein